MDPDEGTVGFIAQTTNSPQTFPKAFAILLRSGHSPEPPGRSDQEDQQEREIVKKEGHA